MKQILGQNLDKAFKVLNIEAKKLVETQENKYQVWELNEQSFDELIMCEEWEESFGWWRSGRSIYEGSAEKIFNVNGKQMLGYINEVTYMDYFDKDYSSYTDWLSEVMCLSTEKNVAIFAESLAEDNGMSLSEFISTFEK
ncbi:hypothetical protein LCM23_13190 [Cytobacillus kochii]|uniref:hypothetical protein n=1 Tax=Cytobacillus kochii TaxID=859143 RepID=UPI001CD45376|nr:hypothetical protein [Cytobacillus kochii]MCA1027050.1 hypothetical protein [Cytobacillus kochii]